MKIIVISGLGAVWGGYHPSVLDVESKATVGGGEAALLRTAFGLAAFGHEVTAFVPLAGEDTIYRGVRFRHLRNAYVSLLTESYDALCSWSDPRAIIIAPPTVRRVYVQQLNDMPESVAFWRNLDALVPASATHGRFLAAWAPNGASFLNVPLYAGVTPELYADAAPWHKRANVVSWWSSPDRGLHHLLAIWPRVRAAIPDAELRIAYHMWRYIDGARDFFGAPEIAYRARALEQNFHAAQRAGGVNVLGPISRVALARHQCETKVLAQMLDPMVPTEGLGVSVAEGIAAGAWVIARPDDAFREVYDGFVQWVTSAICDEAWRAQFAKAVITALRSNYNPYVFKRERFMQSFTWESASRNLERACAAAVKRPDCAEGFHQGM